ncbi:tyrosine-type recombinase/integrase [Tengunoibacter tsumagoiensis]|uniref:Tyrosine recombinase XerC n=1 Tax=Tengunoibacter tsumagoiensis TaxID=2014871 RepID=A0A401ZXN3_9CHLR|nr:tyrosine-type recombinase/integrase [Tengunoibacter tsumagoiensis]GCE11597.1 hypothetical protein KTT_14560 [Tengunoibacter tsumagoiensis]
MQKDAEKDSEQIRHSSSILTEEEGPVEASLFGLSTALSESEEQEEKESVPALTDQSSLLDCVGPYRQELMLKGKSNYTVTCFLSDLKMFSDFMGHDTPVGRLTKETLTDWLMKLKFGNQGQVPAPKTMARRVTFLKNFFSWLAREGIIREDPSASLTLERPLPPLPELLEEEEVNRLLEAAAEDVRCQSLVYLVLYAGLKKEEVMALKVHYIDLADPQVPMVTVHFAASAGKQHRERRLALPSEFSGIFQSYKESYGLTDTVFACTDRNLNYILARAVKRAGITRRVTLQLLRDTFAVRLLQSEESFDTLREKLGLSDEAWLETREKYRRLAFPK